MEANELKGLEKNIKFKRKYYSQGIWKNYAFVPPTLIVFIGLFGLLYLFNNDLFLSVYSIPFVAVLLIGAIWIKATKKYLIDKKVSESDLFVICNTLQFSPEEKKAMVLFSIGANRHNKNYIDKKLIEIKHKYQDTDFFDLQSLKKLENEDLILLPASSLAKMSFGRKKMKKNDLLVVYDGNKAPKLLKITVVR